MFSIEYTLSINIIMDGFYFRKQASVNQKYANSKICCSYNRLLLFNKNKMKIYTKTKYTSYKHQNILHNVVTLYCGLNFSTRQSVILRVGEAIKNKNEKEGLRDLIIQFYIFSFIL